jgi:hypothetical protein
MAGSYKSYVPGKYQTTRQHVLEDSFSDNAEHDAQVNGRNIITQYGPTIRSGFNLGVSDISLTA